MELVASLFQQNQQSDANGSTSPPTSPPGSPESAGSKQSTSTNGGGDIESNGSSSASEVMCTDNEVPYEFNVSSSPMPTQPKSYIEDKNTHLSNIIGHSNISYNLDIPPPTVKNLPRTRVIHGNQMNDVETGDIRMNGGNRGYIQHRQTHQMQVVTPAKTQSTEDTFNDSPNLSPVSSTDSRPKSPKRTRRKIIRFASTNEVRTYTPNPDEFHDHPANAFRTLHRTRGSRWRHFFAVGALPFTYGAISSITTIYFFLELMVRYTLNKKVVGVYLAAAYLTRVLFTSISRVAPKTCILLGSLLTLLGFSMVLLSQRPSFWPFDSIFQDGGLTWFIVGSILANSNEIASGMQMFVREQYIENIKVVGSQLKIQYLITKIARVCTFAGVGFLYKYYNVLGVALLGGGLASLQFLCLCTFLTLDLFRVHYDPNNAFGDDFVDLKPRCRPTCSIRALRGKRRMFKSAMSKLNRTLSKYYPSDLPQSVLRFVIPLCVFGRTLSSVCIWGSTALLIFEDFTTDFVVIGLIFAGASACDFLMSFVMLTNRLEAKLKKICPSPRDLFLGMFGITLSSTLVALPFYPAFIVGFMMYCVCNSILRIILMELQGSSENAIESLTFQVFRRLWTASSLYVLPLLYNLHPRLPFVLGLWFALISSVVLTIYMSCFQSGEVLDDVNLRRNKGAVTAAKNRPSKRPERNLVHAEQVMLGRLMKGKDV